MTNLTEITKEKQDSPRVFPESKTKYVLQTCKKELYEHIQNKYKGDLRK